jgi:RHS repeat-associated protein
MKCYDANNNRTSVLDDAGNTTTYVFDTRNRLLTETDQLGNARAYLYDDNNNRTSATDGNGRVRLFHYDHLNRPTAEEWLDDQVPANVIYTNTMTYNADGTLASNVDDFSSYAYTYDKLGRLETVDNDGTPGPWSAWNVVLTNDYDDNGNRTGLAAAVTDSLGQLVPDFVNEYYYDALNRQGAVAQTDQPGGNPVRAQETDFTYHGDGRMHSIRRYTDLYQLVATSIYGYDDAGRLTSLTHDLPGTANDIAYAWSFNRANRITGYTRSDGGVQTEAQTYGYDDAGQLTSSTGDLPDEAYTYDAGGNRTNDDYDTPTGSDNQLASDGTYTYAYDFEGNLIARGEIATPGNVRLFAWDYRNRLTAVRDYTGYVDEQSPGTLVMEAQYTYDAGNRRISKTVDADGAGGGAAETTQFVHDGGHVVLEFDGSGSITHRYLYGPAVDQVLSDERAGDLLWTLADHQGSVRDIIDASGNPINQITYSAFGERINETAPATSFLFGYTGAVFDIETGLGYHRARYLDHATGRWISEDPIGFAGDPSNVYRYVRNGPTNYVDPSGLAGTTLSGPLIDRISTIRGSHKQYAYFEPFGLAGFFSAIIGASRGISWIENAWISSEARYSSIFNTLLLRGTIRSTSESILMHEMTHALDDKNGWYITPTGGLTTASLRKIEGLGYSAQHIFENLPALQRFETRLKAKAFANNEDINDAWQLAWTQCDAFSTAPIYVSGTQYGNLTDADLMDFETRTGVNISHNAVHGNYDEMVRRIYGPCYSLAPATIRHKSLQ